MFRNWLHRKIRFSSFFFRVERRPSDIIKLTERGENEQGGEGAKGKCMRKLLIHLLTEDEDEESFLIPLSSLSCDEMNCEA